MQSPNAPADTMLDDSLEREYEHALGAGTRVGRYVVQGPLGAGGMGQVYVAVDPTLDREVALKLLHPTRDDSRGALARLVREAQAMAQVNHPNVITVHDVGEHDGGVFIAMERVRGQTLTAWLRAAARPWPQTLDVLRQAAHGLVAVHGRGLVHRDVKPDNVMVGDDGRTRLMDFGLVRTHGATESEGTPSEQPSGGDLLHRSLTRAGAIMGTPRYMAPEQLHGEAVGPAADQFSWCVMAYEALCGQPPFAGSTLLELDEAIARGDVRPPPPGIEVPGWIHRVLGRGLAADPSQRWPDVRAIIGALARDPRPRRRIVIAAIGVLGIGGAVWLGDVARARHAATSCDEQTAAVGQRWNDDVRRRIEVSFAATGLGHADATATRVVPMLNAWIERWADARGDTCGAATGRDEPADTDTALVRACLDELVVDFEALMAGFVDASPTTVNMAFEASAALPAVATCVEHRRPPARSLLSRLVRPGLRRAIADARAAIIAGDNRRAHLEASATVLLADALVADDLRARARYALADARSGAGEQLESAATYEEAFEIAVAVGDDNLAADIARNLTHIVGVLQQRPDQGRQWARAAASSLDRLGVGAHEARRADVATVLALVDEAAGDWDAARAGLRGALATLERVHGPDHPELAGALYNLGTLEHMAGAPAQAEPLLRRASAIRRGSLGPDHPMVAAVAATHGDVLAALGRTDEAVALLRHAWAIRQRSGEADAADVVNLLYSLAHALGPTDEAFALLDHAREVSILRFGVEHRATAMIAAEVGFLASARGDHTRARDEYNRASTLLEQALGPDHASVAQTRYRLAVAQRALGDLVAAQASLEAAAPIIAKNFGAHRLTADVWLGLAEIRIARGDAAGAIEPLQRSIEAYEASGTDDEPLRNARALLDGARRGG